MASLEQALTGRSAELEAQAKAIAEDSLLLAQEVQAVRSKADELKKLQARLESDHQYEEEDRLKLALEHETVNFHVENVCWLIRD